MDDAVALACPACAGVVATTPEGIACTACGRGYPCPFGVPDLRLDVAGFDVEGDLRLAADLDGHGATGASFAELLQRYWAAHPDVDRRLAERFVTGDLVGEDRAREVVGQIERLTDDTLEGRSVLEVGCGTAALSSALSRRAGRVVATDVSLAWLVLARQRLRAAGTGNVSLVACSGDRLPFADEAFDAVVAADVIEHVPDAAALASACLRVLRPGGSLWLSTPNRFSLTPEPHVRLLGVGFLPRRLATAYVRWSRGADYEGIRPLSARRLSSVLGAGGAEVRVVAPPIAAATGATYRRGARAAIGAYNRCCSTPVVRTALVPLAPLFHAVARKPVAAVAAEP